MVWRRWLDIFVMQQEDKALQFPGEVGAMPTTKEKLWNRSLHQVSLWFQSSPVRVC